MSDAKTIVATAPVADRVRAYFAPVNRVTGNAGVFDPARDGRFALEAPPPGWMDAGVVRDFVRRSETKVSPLMSGAPAVARTQVRSAVGAEIAWTFDGWSRLAMALSGGGALMNLLEVAASADARDSGGHAADAVPVLSGSTARVLQVSADAGFAVGDIVVVDVDYGGETGFAGSGISGAYVANADDVTGDPHTVRRVSFNVGRVVDVNGGAVTLSDDLPAGTPTEAMKVAKVHGFVDREGGRFFQEWSALFVVDGVQGDRVLFHYPRLQAAAGAEETVGTLAGQLSTWPLRARMRALPVVDANDGETVFCFRSYLPAAMREVLR
ncbi:MAG: hypothetical protein JSS87_01855 [Acidobacteria bacterium]|nr:hypothetical protein [Acidobacteriota bacterium]